VDNPRNPVHNSLTPTAEPLSAELLTPYRSNRQAGTVDLGFRGEVVDFYHRYRRGYPHAVIDLLVAAFGLSTDDVVVDLGCGTGQLTVPVAERVRAVVGVDPEPDMLARARSAATERGAANVSWLVGSDADVPALRTLLGDRSCGAVTIAQALHWMNHDVLFGELARLVRPGGGMAVVSNGTPLWLQDSGWSRALRGCLEEWLGKRLTSTCGTADADRLRYGDSMTAAGFEVRSDDVEYTDTLDVTRIVGDVCSALSVDQLPTPSRRPDFAEGIRVALAPHAPYTEHIRVPVLTGRIR
jgi:ubiquinone/menaquinone biosynthesis C-methylase UbiE